MDTKEKLTEARAAVRKLEKQVQEEERDDRVERQRILRPVTKIAHDLLCTYNHTDGCSWGYEESAGDSAWIGESSWGRNTHGSWIGKVEQVCAKYKLAPGELTRILDHVVAMRKTNQQAFSILLDLRRI